MSMKVNQALHQLLDEAGISYRVVSHGPTLTSEESAAARGEELRLGGKALVIKVGEEFRLFVLSAALRFDSAAVKRHFGVNKVRFASAALFTLTNDGASTSAVFPEILTSSKLTWQIFSTVEPT